MEPKQRFVPPAKMSMNRVGFCCGLWVRPVYTARSRAHQIPAGRAAAGSRGGRGAPRRRRGTWGSRDRRRNAAPRPPRRRRSVETPRSRPERPLDGRRGTGRDEGRGQGGVDPVVHPPHPSASPKHANRGAERRGEIGFSTSVCRNRSAGACGRARGVGSGAGWACDGVAIRGSWRGDAEWTFGQKPIGGD